MGTSKSTYRQVIDDILLDLTNVPGLSYVKDEMYQNWINRVTARICDEMDIEEQINIELTAIDAVYDISSIMREIKKIRYIHRNNSDWKGIITEESHQKLMQYIEYDTPRGIAYSALEAPSKFAYWTDNERRYIQFYPAPVATEEVTVYYYIGFSPRDHEEEDIETAEIYLPQDYEELLKCGVKMRIYEYLQNEQMKIQMFKYYEQEKKLINGRRGYTSRIDMSYS